MLGGLDPIIIFEFYKKIDLTPPGADGKIPVAAQKVLQFVPLPPIPIYLSEELTGLFIQKETKSIDIGTDTETFLNGDTPDIIQKGIQSGVKVTLLAKKDSIAMMILSAVIDQIYDKVTSKEYLITYLHGATTIFRGVMHNFSADQSADNDLLEINFELSRGFKQPTASTPVPTVPGSSGAIPVGV